MRVRYGKFILPWVTALMLVHPFACTNGDKNKIVISFNAPANISLLQTLRQQLPDFETEFGVRVNLIPFTGQEKLYAMMAAGQPPDVFYTNTVVRDQLAAEGRLLDIRPIAGKDPFVQSIRRPFIERGTCIDNGWYQFCDWTFTYGLYFNKNLFDEKHIAYPDSTWTWAGMLERARQLTCDKDGDAKTDQFGILIAKHFFSAVESMNGVICPGNEMFFTLSAESRQALQLYLDLMYKEKVMPELAFTQAQGMQLSQMLNTGRVAMVAEAVPNLDFITSLNVPWDVAPFPAMPPHPLKYFRSASGGLSISSACRHPDKAWELIKWLVTRSPYNTPNPVLQNVDFVGGWEAKYPLLFNTHFGQVWRLSERYDGGDNRDFVRYFSWSSNTILEQLAPKMDQLFSGEITLDELKGSADDINRLVVDELNKILTNPNIRPAFEKKIREKLAAERPSL
jgi:ABC-type glycerol-3-phosphate transport system substrate-binding protein